MANQGLSEHDAALYRTLLEYIHPEGHEWFIIVLHLLIFVFGVAGRFHILLADFFGSGLHGH